MITWTSFNRAPVCARASSTTCSRSKLLALLMCTLQVLKWVRLTFSYIQPCCHKHSLVLCPCCSRRMWCTSSLPALSHLAIFLMLLRICCTVSVKWPTCSLSLPLYPAEGLETSFWTLPVCLIWWIDFVIWKLNFWLLFAEALRAELFYFGGRDTKLRPSLFWSSIMYMHCVYDANRG